MKNDLRKETYSRVEDCADRLDRCIVTFRAIVRELDKALATLSIEWFDNMD